MCVIEKEGEKDKHFFSISKLQTIDFDMAQL